MLAFGGDEEWERMGKDLEDEVRVRVMEKEERRVEWEMDLEVKERRRRCFLESALRGMRRKREAAVMRAIECGRAVLFYFYLSSVGILLREVKVKWPKIKFRKGYDRLLSESYFVRSKIISIASDGMNEYDRMVGARMPWFSFSKFQSFMSFASFHRSGDSVFKDLLCSNYFTEKLWAHVYYRHFVICHQVSSYKSKFYDHVYEKLYSFFVFDVLLNPDVLYFHGVSESLFVQQNPNLQPCYSFVKKYPFVVGWWTEFEFIEGKLCVKKVHQFDCVCVKVNKKSEDVSKVSQIGSVRPCTFGDFSVGMTACMRLKDYVLSCF